MDLILRRMEHYVLTYTFNTISPAGSSLGVKGRHKKSRYVLSAMLRLQRAAAWVKVAVEEVGRYIYKV